MQQPQIIGDKNQCKELESRRINRFSKSNIYTVGEFLRIYHHELAYHVAVKGFPQRGTPLELIVNDDFAKLIGYTAMGHRGNLREIMEVIVEKGITNRYQNYRPREIPIALLLGLLWISDELDDKNEYRAPIQHELYQNIHNVFSQQQWADNRCVFDPIFNKDLELIYIDANPTNTTQFLRFDKYCKQIQYSLDTVWAILPEYRCNEYRLVAHTVRSKIYEVKNYSFLPMDASFRVNPDIVKHLVIPLYGNNPKYCVRELLANAIDACREREVLDMDYAGKAKIICTVDEDKCKFIIKDNGVGMTANVLVNYFMKVGASFKESDNWKKDFIDKAGHSRVARIGRFGIGVLAAFLIGSEIEITTRHWQDSTGKGYRFIARLDELSPDVEVVECDYGTTISINISNSNFYIMTDLFENTKSDSNGVTVFIPHYMFEYPRCFYCHSSSKYKQKLLTDQIYFYNTKEYIAVKDFIEYKIGIGSILNMCHYPSGIDYTNDSSNGSIINVIYNATGRYFSNEKLSYAKVTVFFYNGMKISLPRLFEDDEKYFMPDNICNHLYINIEDNCNSSVLNLTKDVILKCEVYDQVMKIHAYFLIMYPLTLEYASIFKLFKRHISREDPIYCDFIGFRDNFFEYCLISEPFSTYNYCADYKYLNEAIMDWLVVSHGYEQDYKIPHDMRERKRKFRKAFNELEKYLANID